MNHVALELGDRLDKLSQELFMPHRRREVGVDAGGSSDGEVRRSTSAMGGSLEGRR